MHSHPSEEPIWPTILSSERPNGMVIGAGQTGMLSIGQAPSISGQTFKKPAAHSLPSPPPGMPEPDPGMPEPDPGMPDPDPGMVGSAVTVPDPPDPPMVVAPASSTEAFWIFPLPFFMAK